MQHSGKPQRLSCKAKNRNCQLPQTYNGGIHFLSAPNVVNSGQLQINRKYVNNMGNVNEVAVVQYQRTANLQIKNHTLEVNPLHNVRHHQTQAFVYKTPQFHNHLNPNLHQKFSVNNSIQRKLFQEHTLPTDALQHQYKNTQFNSKKSKELLNQQEANKLNNKIMPKSFRNMPTKEYNSQEESKFVKNTADINVITKEVPVNSHGAEVDSFNHINSKIENQKELEQVAYINEKASEQNQCENVNEKLTKDSREKTPMCLINDLARFNKISFQYRLTGENGPAHCKRFTVTLKLGDEEYTAEGFKIKKAQHLAAKEAIEKTKYKHPTPKPHQDTSKSNVTPTVELNALSMKLGQQTYYISEPQEIGNNSNYGFNCTSFEKNKAPIQQQSTGVVVNLLNNGNQVQSLNQKRHFVQKFQNRHSALQNSLQNGSIPSGRKYFPSTSPCKITLLVGSNQFAGVGRTLQQAKHDAASNALQVLKERLETHEEEVQDSDNKSPISLVFEMGIKRNLPVDFKVLKEEGPAHMRTFITACIVGDITTEGKGNGKKISKKKAAQKMLEELKKLPPLPSAVSPVKRVKLKTSNKKCRDPSKNMSAVQTKDDMQKTSHKKVTTELEEENPINKLLEYHQSKKKKEPVFKLINEYGKTNSHRRQFVMEVNSNQVIARGVGNSKRTAKQVAAKNCLAAIAESEQNSETAAVTENTPIIDNVSEKDEPVSDKNLHEKAHQTIAHNKLACGKQENADEISNLPFPTHVTVVATKDSTNGTNTLSKSKNLHMKDQLMYLSKLLCFDVEFSDYPKGNHNEFLTIVMLSTNPPQICHGVGVNATESQEDAAKNALKILSEMGLNNAVKA